MVRTKSVETYNLSHQLNVLAPHEENPSGQICVKFASEETLDGVLKDEIACPTSVS